MYYDPEILSCLRERILEVTGAAVPFPVEACAGPGLKVDWSGGMASVQAEDRSALCRALFLLSLAVSENKSSLHVEERRHFAHCGAMLDMSRNRVMTVEGVKKWIDRQAALGLNLLMLYTEDTYEVPEYPYFGYLRGRYTREELKEIDDYAFAMGVELVPCVQTLGHLKQFLQWPSSASLRDQPGILLIDEEKTYDFLDSALGTLSGCFRTRRIHIGMDEAHGVGLGNYLLRHGMTDRFELLSRHLERVVAICRKYGFRPMMWSDMYFRLGSKTNSYYDPESHVPDRIISSLPPVEMVYWDYYHTDEAFYEHMLEEHRRMKRNTVFAGGVWTWSGFLPNREHTLRTMLPALRTNVRKETDTVIATFWGDDGAETDYLLGMDRLTLFSEACWKGESFSAEECEPAARCLTGMGTEVRNAFDAFYADSWEDSTGKALIWCDPLYPCGISEKQKEILARAAEGAEAVLDAAPSTPETVYALALFRTLRGKIRLIRSIRSAYAGKDRQALSCICAGELPALVKAYEALAEAHRALWESNSRRQGWEVLALRYGGAVGRLKDVAGELERFASGRLESIPELDEAELPDGKGSRYDQVSTPSAKT